MRRVYIPNLSVTSTVTVTSFNVVNDIMNAISLTSTGNVLVSSLNAKIVSEYDPSGSPINSVSFDNSPLFATEFSSGVWVVSFDVGQIVKVFINGTMMASFGVEHQLSTMIVSASKHIIAVDTDQSIILVVNPTLTASRVLPFPFSFGKSICPQSRRITG